MHSIAPAQAVEIAGHHHYSILVFFMVGFLLHAALQIDAIARAKNNPLNLRTQIFEQNAIRLAARLFVSVMIFLYVWKNPSTVPVIVGYFGITLNPTAVAVLTLPMSQPVAGMMGFAVDSLLAYIPVLKNALPCIEFTQTETVTHTVSTTVNSPSESK